MNESDLRVFGPAPDAATHWSMLRLAPGDKRAGDAESYPDAVGVLVRRWLLSELSVEEVRRRWGAGRYRAQWFTYNAGKFEPQGSGAPFELTPEEAPATPAALDPLAQFERIRAAAKADAAADLDRTIALMATLRGAAPGTAVPLSSEDQAELARLRRENEELRMRQTVREETDRMSASFRLELDERDRKIRALERESDERDRARPDDGPTFEPGTPIVDTLVSAAMNFAIKNPEAIAPIIAPILARVMGGAAAPPPVPVPAPPPQLHGDLGMGSSVRRDLDGGPIVPVQPAGPTVVRRPVVIRFPVPAEPIRSEPYATPAASAMVQKDSELAAELGQVPAPVDAEHSA